MDVFPVPAKRNIERMHGMAELGNGGPDEQQHPFQIQPSFACKVDPRLYRFFKLPLHLRPADQRPAVLIAVSPLQRSRKGRLSYSARPIEHLNITPRRKNILTVELSACGEYVMQADRFIESQALVVTADKNFARFDVRGIGRKKESQIGRDGTFGLIGSH